MPLFESVHDIARDAEILRRRPYGVICVEDEQLRCIRLRPWPKIISQPEIALWGQWLHGSASGDRCWLYYNQPLRHRNFLALKYVVSSQHASFKTFRGALVLLDEMARIKRSDAILCEVPNRRISDRLLRRWGWERHLRASRRRHFIKRFYGSYPDPAAVREWTSKGDRHAGP